MSATVASATLACRGPGRPPAAGPGPVSGPRAGAAARLDTLIRGYAERGEFQGVALVAEGGRVVYQRAFGPANMEWGVPNTTTTRFHIGSVTKPLTAVLVLQALERGELRLDAPVSTYLPDYPKPAGDRITVRHLLSHTSGLPDFPDVPGLEWNRERLAHSRAELLAEFAALPLRFEPGTDVRYSNFGYSLLVVLLEQVTGRPYAALLQERICAPAGMTRTAAAEPRAVLPERAAGYFRADSGGRRVWRNAPFFDPSVVVGAGDVISTAEDLWRFDQALYDDRLLSAPSRALLFAPTMPAKDNYALGWYVRLPAKHPGPDWARHSGSVNGFSAILLRLPEGRRTVVLLSNAHGVRTTAISDAVKQVLYAGG